MLPVPLIFMAAALLAVVVCRRGRVFEVHVLWLDQK
jgi:hypothetical protein